jgi:hypothetical protein
VRGRVLPAEAFDSEATLLESVRTSRSATHLRTRAQRVGVVIVAACGCLLLASLALGAASFADASGDDNAAPDITSVQLSESADGVVTLTVAVANYSQLPTESWFNLWFDLDSNPNTGDAGDEVLVRYVSGGDVELWEWHGAEMVERAAVGIAGRYEGGVLTVTVPKSELGGDTVFGVLAVSSRSQDLGQSQLIASDYAPDRGRSPYTGPAASSFPDAGDDQDAAPDMTAVRVSDDKDGWITFVVSTPNYATLPSDSVLALAIDGDGRPATGDAGAELLIRSLAGEVIFERWSQAQRGWLDDRPPHRVRIRNSASTVTVEVHRSELGNAARFGFSLASLDVNTQAESVLAADLAPDDGGFYQYALVNKPALRLLAGRVSATPARPRAGKPFAVSVAVRRSDTNRPITSGNVSCRVVLGGTPLRARGSVVGGAARCSVALPSSAAGSRLRGTISVRIGTQSASANFAYVVG